MTVAEWGTLVGSVGQQNGLSQGQVWIAAVIGWIEGAGGSGYGDYVNGKPTSFGPFQFNVGGALPGFQAWLAQKGQPVSLQQAGTIAATQPLLATQYALQNGTGYLWQSIMTATRNGLSGIPGAVWVEINAERPLMAPSPGGMTIGQLTSKIASVWSIITGTITGSPPPITTPPIGPILPKPPVNPPVTTPINPPITPPATTVPIFAPPTPTTVTNLPSYIGQLVGSVFSAGLRVFWIIVGIVLILAGLLILLWEENK